MAKNIVWTVDTLDRNLSLCSNVWIVKRLPLKPPIVNIVIIVARNATPTMQGGIERVVLLNRLPKRLFAIMNPKRSGGEKDTRPMKSFVNLFRRTTLSI